MRACLVVDLNLNLFDYSTNTKVKDSLNLTFIKKPTRITKTKGTLTDHILTHDFVKTDSTGIVKSNISDYFPIFLVTSAQFFNNIQNKTAIKKRKLNEKSNQHVMDILNKVNWKHFYSITDTNLAYEYFLRTFNGLYNHVLL